MTKRFKLIQVCFEIGDSKEREVKTLVKAS